VKAKDAAIVIEDNNKRLESTGYLGISDAGFQPARNHRRLETGTK
jgi:hypothetical protein